MIKKFLVFSALLCSAVFCNAQNAQLEAAVGKLTRLMVTPDSLGLDSILLDNLSYGHSNGGLQSKPQFMRSLLTGASDFVEIDLTDKQVVIQNKIALVRHTLSAKTNDKNIPGKVKLYILLVWSNEKTGWKLLARQAVKVPEK
ncbi:nuclear transport factor 2 family protein [Pedobacter sp. R-06]|uniref:nuclear transport factor 2 family protein n=1 Tax=Pedobacter sp. R-06 TaxID=3404051 RepID=UPI003CF51252